MAKDKKSRTSSLFVSCFGMPKTGTRSNDTDREKEPRRRLPLPRLWFKKPGAKTVPVAAIDVDVKSVKAEARRRYEESRSKLGPKARRSKSSGELTGSRSKSESKVRHSKSLEELIGSKRLAAAAPAPVPAASDQDKHGETRTEITADQNPEPENLSELPGPRPRDSGQLPGGGLSFRRKMGSTKAGIGGWSQPGYTVLRTRPGPMARSASFPGPPRKKRKHWDGGLSRDLDPVLGISVVMVALIITVLGGRLCAVLCTCAWLYLIPLLRPMGRIDGGEGAAPEPDPNWSDLSYEEHKKKVVLEGLLERNRRR